jgi:hypothetical protein
MKIASEETLSQMEDEQERTGLIQLEFCGNGTGFG